MTVWAALLEIDDGACCTTAEAREMVAVRMSDDDGCALSMTADDEGQGDAGAHTRSPVGATGR